MAVTETLRALGSWGVTFKESLPDDLWKRIEYFGHVAIHVGRHPGPLDDSLLRSARYVGPCTAISDSSAAKRTIGGEGMATWLGDADSKGDTYTTPITVNGDFDDVIRALLPASGAVTEGTLFNTGETFGPSTFQYQSPREVIDYICQTLGDHAWRVNGDGTLDAGLESQLFRVNPKCVVARKKISRTVAGFEDMFLHGLAGMAETERDVKDFSTGVLLLAQGINGSFVSAEVNTPPAEIPFKDIHGNTVVRKRIVSEQETDGGNAEARAQLQLNRFKGSRDALTLSTSDYDIKGKAQVGDYLWVYDPGMELVDIANEVMFRGERINPFKLRLTETSWPITRSMSVFFRTGDGEWIDLSEHVQAETGDTTLVVGGYNRSLTEGGTSPFPVTPPEADTSVPGVVEWVLPFLQAMYQSPQTGESKSWVDVKWEQPLNEDLSTITDGAYYEIRYRQSTTPFFAPTVGELENYQLDEVQTVGGPITIGAAQEWQFVRAPFDALTFRLQELMPGMTYEAQIRAVDSARPANLGDWSDLVQWQNSRDIFPPATPAAPVIASSPAAVLMRHNLGRADGGEFNLDRDLGHLELHGSIDPLFNPDQLTLIGKVAADWGMITGEVPIVTSFQITEQNPMHYRVVAVDLSGNRSLPSAAVVATAELWGDKYIQNLTVDKITAGTISADWIIGSYIRTGKTGSRVELSYKGIEGYGADNVKRLWWDSASGQLRVIGSGGIAVTGDKGITISGGGNVEITNGRLEIKNNAGQVIVEVGECSDGRHGIQVYRDSGFRVTRIGELQTGSEGIETINDLGQLVRVDTLAFGMKAANTAGNIDVSAAAFNPAAPSVSGVVIGNSGRALVHIGSWIGTSDGSNTAGAAMSFYGTGPGGASFAAAILQAINASGQLNLGMGRGFLVEGLTAGSWTFGCSYRANVNGQVTHFTNRSIAVQPF